MLGMSYMAPKQTHTRVLFLDAASPCPTRSLELRCLGEDLFSNIYPTCRLRRLRAEIIKHVKTFNNGSLGSRIDEERSEMR